MTEILDLSPDELLTTTRAVRRRLDLNRPVDRSVIEKCLEIGFQAPSGENTQAWGWVAVDDPAVRAQMADIYRAGVNVFVKEEAAAAEAAAAEAAAAEDRQGPLDRMGMEITDVEGTQRVWESAMYLADHLQEVPVLVVPLLKTRFENLRLFEAASAWGSVMPAAWNFMLALRARGLGSVWTTAHLWCEKDMTELLGLPADNTQVGLFPVAYTKGTDFKPARRGPVRDVLHWNSWGS
ncbi:nitroreductase family protein [Nocardia sp. NPDC005745]|uniref:nitroreductase family protein n=1 Tax=Nocardia sp. NPDC005745 TaxID=3157061 RepID=UPI0033D76401